MNNSQDLRMTYMYTAVFQHPFKHVGSLTLRQKGKLRYYEHFRMTYTYAAFQCPFKHVGSLTVRQKGKIKRS